MPSKQLLNMRRNIDELSSNISSKAHLVPPDIQCGVLRTTEDLLQSLDRLSNSRICQGIVTRKDYLSEKGVRVKGTLLVRNLYADEEETIAFVRIESTNRIESASLFCSVLLSSLKNICDSCSNIQDIIREKDPLTRTISLQNDHSFCRSITKLDQLETWSPFLREYFKEILQRKAQTTKPWPAAILVFSLSLYTKLGTTSFEYFGIACLFHQR